MTTNLADRPHYPRFHELLQHIEGLDYRNRRIFLWHRVEPRLFRFLYKFRALEPTDKMSVDHLQDILVRSRLWLSSAADFNDPFDMSGKLIAEGTLKQRQERFKEILKWQQLKWKERGQKLSHLMTRTSAELAATAQAVHRRNLEAAGVYSFAGDPRSILMWSHYAANHQGLCLQFEVAKDIRTFAHAISVGYSDEYPVINWITEFESKLPTTMLRKHTGWSYERESRIVMPNSAHEYFEFRPEALRGIIFGSRANSSMITMVRELLTERSSLGWTVPILYVAKQHESRYHIVIHKFNQ